MIGDWDWDWDGVGFEIGEAAKWSLYNGEIGAESG